MRDWIHGVPDLLIEALPPDNAMHDRIVKRNLYAQNGVPEYWIVDPIARSVEVLVHDRGHFAPHGYFETSDTIRSHELPDLTIPVADVFAD